jgi:hypothetical protein
MQTLLAVVAARADRGLPMLYPRCAAVAVLAKRGPAVRARLYNG